jgi:hypothetical protein
MNGRNNDSKTQVESGQLAWQRLSHLAIGKPNTAIDRRTNSMKWPLFGIMPEFFEGVTILLREPMVGGGYAAGLVSGSGGVATLTMA